ncbi:protein adenylyltransferase SelO [uncultured Pelagimonas sp.]|uniref:protein adenylyltransferase SelO n=1 Tax=uncultured Pelagimonas sp. TaxID=1618102 RepID=UPI00261E8F83|nr:YdiU family protein [uncultured Pelagimonas sp.]
MTLHIPFDNSYARLPDPFHSHQPPTPVQAPSLIAFNHDLAAELGITGTDDPQLASYFAGNMLPQGAEPIAQLYAGHQFGQYNPQLGDGRAILLGEVVNPNGLRRDIQLKGSGQTPYSRRGDGRAWLGPVLREYVVSEAMHALGVPTTRALAATRTGQDVIRDRPLPGAVLTRVAQSHIRVGTFQVFAARGETDALKTLFEYTVDRHYPQAQDPSDLLQMVMDRQAALIPHWMSFGFIHGVMNTDNCTLSGETIDYGPCAFLDGFDAHGVFSSIDRRGRYAYSAQADIIAWNMAQLATSLIPLMPDQDRAVDQFTKQINAMPELIRANWLSRFAAKIGIASPAPDDETLITDLLILMHKDQADFTNTFRALVNDTGRDQFVDRAAFDSWRARWQSRIETETAPDMIMKQANPAFIPRNHRIEQMIDAAVAGDDDLFHRLNRVLANPFDDQPDESDLAAPPQPSEVVKATFCGT